MKPFSFLCHVRTLFQAKKKKPINYQAFKTFMFQSINRINKPAIIVVNEPVKRVRYFELKMPILKQQYICLV
jgi:hypothetical protein